MKKRLKFFFPIPSIIILVFCGILLCFGEIDGVHIQIKDWLFFMVILFIFLILPLDIIFFAMKKIYFKLKLKKQKINMKVNQNVQSQPIKSNSKGVSILEEENIQIPVELGVDETHNKTLEMLNYYKNNFFKLDDVEKGLYVGILNSMLDIVKTDASILNTTTEIKVFVNHWNHLIDSLETLSQHEFTGYFSGTLPSKNLETIINNRHLTEIKFIKRSFLFHDGKYIISDNDKTYLKLFTKQAITFINTGTESATPKYKPDTNTSYQNNTSFRPKHQKVDVERFARECNAYLRKLDYQEIAAVTHESKDMVDRHTFIISETTNKNFDNMDGHDFEYFCADLLRKNGFKNVEVTKGSGDQGIDIVAEKDGIKYAIQCKCYSSDINNKAVQEAFAGKTFYNCHVAAVLTNRYFTQSAKELAEKNNVLLWDRNYLENLISNAKENAD